MMLFHENVSDIYKMKENAKSLYRDYLKECIHEQTRKGLLKIVKRMIDEEDIQGLILGCTELPLIAVFQQTPLSL
jgi:aspartate/glutamate racemase